MKKGLLILLPILLLGIGFGYYQYTLPMPKVEDLTTDYEFEAGQLYRYYTANEQEADAQLLDKLLLVTGTVKNLVADGNQLSVILEGHDQGGIICEIDERLIQQTDLPRIGQKVQLKGVCTGLLLDVVLVDCVLIA